MKGFSGPPAGIAAVLGTLAPGFLPLLAYILVETFFGETAGLVAGIVLGAGEFAFILVRERKADPFVAGDTLLLAALGAASLAFRTPLFFKLKPAIVEGLMAIALAGLLSAPDAVLQGWLERQMKTLAPEGGALPTVRKRLVGMTALLGIHAVASALAALFLSEGWWAFISGGLLYILLGAMVAWTFLAARARSRGLGPSRGVALDWFLLVTDGKGSVYAVRSPGASGEKNAAWDFPACGRVIVAKKRGPDNGALPTEIVKAVGNALGAFVDPAAEGEIRLAPLGLAQGEGGGSGGIFVAAILDAAAIRKGRDPSRERFWSLSDLAAAAGGGALAARFGEALDLIVRVHGMH